MFWFFNFLTQGVMNWLWAAQQYLCNLLFWASLIMPHKFIDQMLKLILFIINFYNKLLITDRIINKNKSSLTKGPNKRNNFRHEIRTDIKIFKSRHFFKSLQVEKEREILNNTINFTPYKNINYLHKKIFFFHKYSSSLIDSAIIYHSKFFWSFPSLMAWARILVNPNICITIWCIELSSINLKKT